MNNNLVSKKIAILSGSFDPIHDGHIQIAKYCLDNLDISELWFSLIKCSPFKNKTIYDCHLLHKYMILKNEINKHSNYNFKIDEWEMNNVKGSANYSIDYARYLATNCKDTEFYFLIGDDQLARLHEWKEINELAKIFKIIIFKRREREFDKQEVKNLEKYCFKYLDNPVFKGKSRNINRGIKMTNISEDTLKYINKYNIYFYSQLKHHLSKARIIHSINVSKAACTISYKHNIDLRKTFTAAIFHDIFKEMNNDDIKEYVTKHNIVSEFKKLEKYESHAFLAAHYIKNVLKIDDSEVYSAILNHTVPTKHMSKLDKIIFIADKICKDREFNGKAEIWTNVMDDLNDGFISVLEHYKQHLQTNKIKISSKLKEVINFYIKNE